MGSHDRVHNQCLDLYPLFTAIRAGAEHQGFASHCIIRVTALPYLARANDAHRRDRNHGRCDGSEGATTVADR